MNHIENDRQLKITRKWVKRFTKAAEGYEMSRLELTNNYAWNLVYAQAARAQASQLREQVSEYMKTGGFKARIKNKYGHRDGVKFKGI